MHGARTPIKAVVDTNLFISGMILKRGRPFALLEAWRARWFILLIGDQQRDELAAVLQRAKLRERYDLPPEDVALLLRLVDAAAVRVPLSRRLPVSVRDAKDEMILASALGGQAGYLVTGDSDLLILRNNPHLGDLKIVTVAEFLAVLATMRPPQR
ncbi:MAG: putative toxin-antitoxin system toxin component, PIN family [Chloroflexi bacterium]|nr:putative toxin-antitoxin system toxin component, PIN family [Chloroflexota bacterium]